MKLIHRCIHHFLLQSDPMKLAIIGHSPLALEAALRFHLHGASLTWFLDQDDFSQFDSPGLKPNAFTTDLGMSLLQEIDCRYSPEAFSWKEWMNGYKRPLGHLHFQTFSGPG